AANVATDVSAEVAATPGKARGLKRKFALISGVTAELTGKQILKLAKRPWISAITLDAPVAASDSTPPANTGTPRVSGTAQDGATLTVDAGTWTGDPTPAYSYEWQRCGGPSRADILADAPMGFWPLADANGTAAADASGHGLAGTYAPGVSVAAVGPDDAPAARLDGLTGGVAVPGISSTSLSAGFTIE